MVEYLIVHLNGLLLDISDVYDSLVKTQWISLRQSNVKFDLSFEEYEELEKRVRPMISGDGNDFWTKFWKHMLIELGVHPVPSVVDGLVDKFRTFFINSSKLYPDVNDFLSNAHSRGVKVVLADSGSKETIDRALQKFNLKNSFYRVLTVDYSRNQKEFFDSVVEQLEISKSEAAFFCSRADRDFALLSEIGFKAVLVTRRFYEKVNRKLPEVFARNLLQALDLLSAEPKEESIDSFFDD